MTKSNGSNRDAAAVRESRPFLYLKPASLPLASESIDPIGLQQLDACLQPQIGYVVRSLVNYTIATSNAKSVRMAQPIRMSVLNRRRRAARSWLVAISEGRMDAATRHAVATQWLPMLCGTGPDRELAVAPARLLIEFVRGAITGCIFDAAKPSLLAEARALHVLESTLAAHLAAVQQMVPSVRQASRSLAAVRT